jgi:hypothetical protein
LASSSIASTGTFLKTEYATFSLSDSTFVDIQGYDGEFFSFQQSSGSFGNVTFASVSIQGGALLNMYSSSSIYMAETILKYCTVQTGDFISVDNSYLELHNSTFTQMTAESNVGVIQSTADSNVSAYYCTFSDCTAENGAAFYAKGKLYIRHSKFSSNTFNNASSTNAVIYHIGNSLTVDYSTFKDATSSFPFYISSTGSNVLLRNNYYASPGEVKASFRDCYLSDGSRDTGVCDSSGSCSLETYDVLCYCVSPAYGDPTVSTCKIPNGQIAIVPSTITFSATKPSNATQNLYFVNQGSTSVGYNISTAKWYCSLANYTSTDVCVEYASLKSGEGSSSTSGLSNFLYKWSPSSGSVSACNYVDAQAQVYTSLVQAGTYTQYFIVKTDAEQGSLLITTTFTVTVDVDSATSSFKLNATSTVAGDTLGVVVYLRDVDGIIAPSADTSYLTVKLQTSKGNSLSCSRQSDGVYSKTYTCTTQKYQGGTYSVSSAYNDVIINTTSLNVSCQSSYVLDNTTCLCKPGEYEAFGTSCTGCSVGRYKSAYGTESCSNCTQYINFSTTAITGASNVLMCDSCSDGFSSVYNYSTGYLSFCGCAPGSYLTDSSVCSKCPNNTYLGIISLSRACTSCPSNSISNEGSTVEGNCSCDSTLGFVQNPSVNVSVSCTCPPGSHFSSAKGQCALCPKGQYNPDYGQSQCTTCPGNFTTTVIEGNTNVSSCVCEDGFVRDSTGTCVCPVATYFNDTACVACPADTYKNFTGSARSCTSCPDYSISNKGSSSVLNCTCTGGFEINTNLKNFVECVCPAGYLYNETSTGCSMCPIGEYKSQQGNTQCVKCAGTYQETKSLGSTNSSQCVCKGNLALTGTSTCLCKVCIRVDHFVALCVSHAMHCCSLERTSMRRTWIVFHVKLASTVTHIR